MSGRNEVIMAEQDRTSGFAAADVAARKAELRKRLKEIRNNLPEEDRIAESRAIMQTLTRTEMYQNARFILTYVSSGSEVDTRDFITQAIKDQKSVYVPKVMESLSGRRMEFFRCDDLTQLHRGAMGIMEPEADYAAVFPYDIHMSLDRAEECLVIVPGLGFDERLGRIGYGGGYYDRFLTKCRKKFSIGIAFKEQMVDEIPMDEYDTPVDLVLTSDRAYF